MHGDLYILTEFTSMRPSPGDKLILSDCFILRYLMKNHTRIFEHQEQKQDGNITRRNQTSLLIKAIIDYYFNNYISMSNYF
jgi:hypothetical protein